MPGQVRLNAAYAEFYLGLVVVEKSLRLQGCHTGSATSPAHASVGCQKPDNSYSWSADSHGHLTSAG